MKRPLFWASLCAIAGTLVAFSEMRILTVPVIVLSLLAVIFVFVGRTVSRIVIVLPIGALLGVFLCLMYLQKERNCTEQLFAMREIRCIVTEVNRESFTVMPEENPYGSFRIFVYSREELPGVGDRVAVEGPLANLPVASNEGEWDAAS